MRQMIGPDSSESRGSSPQRPGFGAIRSHRPDPWRSGEPVLAEVMADPLVHLLMRRDGLHSDQVWPVIEQARLDLQRLKRGGTAHA